MLVVGLSAFMPGALKGNEKINVGVLVRSICANDFSKTLFWMAFLATMMSTTDSILNALATMWAHDLIAPFWQKGRDTDKEELWSAPLVTALFGLISIPLALFLPLTVVDLLEYACLSLSILSIPFVMGVLGLKGESKGFKLAIDSFSIVFFVTRILSDQGILDSFLLALPNTREQREFYFSNPITNQIAWRFAMPISLFSFLAHHYMSNDGHFVFILREEGTWKVSDRYKLNFNLRFLKEPVG